MPWRYDNQSNWVALFLHHIFMDDQDQRRWLLDRVHSASFKSQGNRKRLVHVTIRENSKPALSEMMQVMFALYVQGSICSKRWPEVYWNCHQQWSYKKGDFTLVLAVGRIEQELSWDSRIVQIIILAEPNVPPVDGQLKTSDTWETGLEHTENTQLKDLSATKNISQDEGNHLLRPMTGVFKEFADLTF